MSTKSKPVERDWTPVRRGAIYCSPACGFSCTWEAHEAAKVKGETLAKRCGPGYTFEVHENGTWNYRAVSPCQRIGVHEHGRQYLAFLGDAEHHGVLGRYSEWGSTPQKAIANALAAARAHLASIEKLIEGFPIDRAIAP